MRIHPLWIIAVVSAVAAAGCSSMPDLASANAASDLTARAFASAGPDAEGRLSPEKAKEFGISETTFAAVNQDNDGTLEAGEFATSLEMQFSAADTDKDGLLDWSQAQAAGVRGKGSFMMADQNHDDKLNHDEYVTALMLQ